MADTSVLQVVRGPQADQFLAQLPSGNREQKQRVRGQSLAVLNMIDKPGRAARPQGPKSNSISNSHRRR